MPLRPGQKELGISAIRDMPIVSIIMPTYHQVQLLTRAICYVLARTYQDFEAIVVDDGS